jgi:hypothetical protein
MSKTLFQNGARRHTARERVLSSALVYVTSDSGRKHPLDESDDDEAPEVPTDEPPPLPIQDPPSDATPPEPLTV